MLVFAVQNDVMYAMTGSAVWSKGDGDNVLNI